MFSRLELIIAEAAADTAALFPRMHNAGILNRACAVAVLRRVMSAVTAARILTPAVVYDDSILDLRIVVKPREKTGRTVLVARIIPFTVRPDDVGLVAVGEILKLGEVYEAVPISDRKRGFGSLRIASARILGIGIFEHREVKAALKARLAHSLAEFACKIAPGAEHDRIEVGRLGARPKSVSVVMLGGQDDVFGACALKKARPLGGVVESRLEIRGEIGVGSIAVKFLMMA